MVKIDEALVSDFLLNPKKRVLRHLLLQFVILVITLDIFIDGFGEINLSPGRFYGWIGYYFIISLVVYCNLYLLVPRLLIKNKPVRYFLLSIALVVIALLIAVVVQTLFEDSSGPVPDGNIYAALLSLFSSIFSIALLIAGTAAILLFRYWMRYDRRRDELETATLQSELKYLKNQINPHFLFNMLNNANIMAEENPSLSSRILTRLNGLLRYQFRDSARDNVLLASDIAFLTDFLELEKTRRDHFDYTVSQKGDIAGIRIPPLLFIPFVENAVKHNTDSPGAYVRISFNISDDKLEFACENSKLPYPIKKGTSGLGLVNIKRRLDLLFPGDNHVLEIKETATVYTVKLHVVIFCDPYLSKPI